MVYDVVRGANKDINTDSTEAEETQVGTVTAFGSNSYTLGTHGGTNANGETRVSWNWSAGGGSGSSNTDGTIASTVSANTTAGFSIVKYTGNGSANQTVGHGLGTTPKFKIIKSLGAAAEGWVVTGLWLGSTVGNRIFLNTTAALGNPSGYYALDTSTTIGISASNNPTSQNASGQDYIAYCFAEKTGYSKFGTYEGNGNASGTFVYTGFKPAWLMVKRYSGGTNDWLILDNKRDPINQMGKGIVPNNNSAEATGYHCDFFSNGFKWRLTGSGENGSNFGYIFAAFAEEPLVANVGQSIPATAR
jgi:hypothetical protein